MAEFIWNVEELKLKDLNRTEFAKMANNYTQKELENAIDTYGGYCKFAVYYELRDKFQKEKDSIKRDKWGRYNTMSLKAWCKKASSVIGTSTDWHGTPILCINYGYYNSLNLDASEESIHRIAQNAFINVLERLMFKEREYFKENDEESVLANEILEYANKYQDVLDYCLMFNDNYIMLRDHDENGNPIGRRLTVDELKELLAYFKQIDAVVKAVTKPNFKVV